MTYEVKLSDFITPEECIRKCGTGIGGHVQKAVDAAVIRYTFPYVPFGEGILAGSANTATRLGSGEVTYDTPYAHYQHEGEIWGPNYPIRESGEIVGWFSPPEKYPTGRPLQYDKSINPLAGPHWFERAMGDHSDDVLKEAQDAAEHR